MDILVRRSVLHGQVHVQGSKNAAMLCIPVACATGSHLSNVPDTTDIRNFHELLEQNGVQISEARGYDASGITELVSGPSSIRHATLLLGLGCALGVPVRLSVAVGGCDIGLRKFDMHVEALRAMGARIELVGPDIYLYPENLIGADIEFYYPTFSGTINVVLTALSARGTTRITNAAINPEVIDAIVLLRETGARIKYTGYHCLEIVGGTQLHGVHHRIIGDRIVAATLIAGALATDGQVEVAGVSAEHLIAEIDQWRRAGAHIRTSGKVISVFPSSLYSTNLDTGPYPAFHSDIQPLYGATMLNANGAAQIRDWIYDSRHRHYLEMAKLGARIKFQTGDFSCVNGALGTSVIVRGRGDSRALRGVAVSAPDIRGGAALVIAGMMSEGETVIENAEVIGRGYENIVDLFERVGADIEARQAG